MGEPMLRISINPSDQGTVIKLEGRVAGPWVAELSRTWKDQAPLLERRKLILDLRDITFSDSAGTQVLRDIYAETRAGLIAGNPWTDFLAEEIKRTSANPVDQEL
jgi:anti-anti-sigma regulatory factor